MTIPELGNLEEVDLREAWPHEARSFTPWLSENLEILLLESPRNLPETSFVFPPGFSFSVN